jgi:hypothetical protein
MLVFVQFQVKQYLFVKAHVRGHSLLDLGVFLCMLAVTVISVLTPSGEDLMASQVTLMITTMSRSVGLRHEHRKVKSARAAGLCVGSIVRVGVLFSQDTDKIRDVLFGAGMTPMNPLGSEFSRRACPAKPRSAATVSWSAGLSSL